MREPPRWFRGGLLQAYNVALQQWATDKSASSWKLLILPPRMLLRPTGERGDTGKQLFQERLRRFNKGEWLELLTEAKQNEQRPPAKELDSGAAPEKRREQAERKVRLREVRRARVLLTSSGLAPGDAATLAELTNPEVPPTKLSEEVPAHLLFFVPDVKVKLDKRLVLEALRTAGKGSAQDLSGTWREHLRVCLDDDEVWSLLVQVLQAFARGELPSEVAAAFRLGRLTPLKKDNGKVRGIVAGFVFRRLCCKAVARQFADDFLATTAPYQYALQTKAGTEALAHALHFLTDYNSDTIILAVDGVGAFDHLKRAAFFKKLHALPNLQPLLPLAGLLYGSPGALLLPKQEAAVIPKWRKAKACKPAPLPSVVEFDHVGAAAAAPSL